MSFLANFWDTIWWMLTVFVFIAYLMALFSIIGDLFRDRKLNGFAKAAWLFFLVFLPFATALIYLIARGRGMGERASVHAQRSQADAEQYIRSVVSERTPTDEIVHAKELLDSGAITTAEYQSLKSAAIAQSATIAQASAVPETVQH